MILKKVQVYLDVIDKTINIISKLIPVFKISKYMGKLLISLFPIIWGLMN
jgi:hypothetical protein